ncbi:MAG: General stress protein 69 [Alphaproteobacteria bacterium MarineAlpha5_Bin12]|nr:MAG: General stress protein 69 [Alphaproteobacteria bacterium MarineAlpha5_Bin12]|tara:strand:- start:6952 stop:8007 length:1056 start_codon:yes stop_codon:yes gene_type:complete
MKYRKLGTTDLNVSVICLGTMTWGEQNNQQEGFDQMNYALERGINFFDTAELYAVMPRQGTYGKTEEIIGNWFKEKNNRDKVILASKIASKTEGDLNWIRGGSKNLGFDKKNINEAIDASLKRLKTDYIDLYQLHWPERKVPKFGTLDFEYDPKDNDWTAIEEVLENLNNLVKLGKIRYVGLSNETPWGVMKFIQISKEKKLPRMMSIQNVYSLVNRVFDIANSEVSIREQCGLLAYSPLAGGRLSGKYISNSMPKGARYTIWPRRFSRHHTKRGEIAIEAYVNLAKKYGIAPSTFANAFVNDRPFVTSNIIGATTMEQLKENIDSVDLTLSKEILKEIQDIHLSDPNPCV